MSNTLFSMVSGGVSMRRVAMFGVLFVLAVSALLYVLQQPSVAHAQVACPSPTNVTVSSSNPGELTVSWVAPTGSDASNIIEYRTGYDTSNDPALMSLYAPHATPSDTSITHTGVPAGTYYGGVASNCDNGVFSLPITVSAASQAVVAGTAPTFSSTQGDFTSYITFFTNRTLPGATGGNGTLTYTLTGSPSLPPGLSFTAGTRKLTGTPTTLGTYAMTYTVADSDTNTDADDTAVQTFTVTVAAPTVSIALTESAGPANPHTFTITATVAPTYYSPSVEEYKLVSASTACTNTAEYDAITGTATSIGFSLIGTSGGANYSADVSFSTTANNGSHLCFKVQLGAAIAYAKTTNDINVTAVATPTFGASTISDQSYTINTAITNLVLPAATGGSAPLVYSISSLPAGLSFAAASRTLSGTPTAAGTTAMTYTVTDANSATATLTFDIVVAAAVTCAAPTTVTGLTSGIQEH